MDNIVFIKSNQQYNNGSFYEIYLSNDIKLMDKYFMTTNNNIGLLTNKLIHNKLIMNNMPYLIRSGLDYNISRTPACLMDINKHCLFVFSSTKTQLLSLHISNKMIYFSYQYDETKNDKIKSFKDIYDIGDNQFKTIKRNYLYDIIGMC